MYALAFYDVATAILEEVNGNLQNTPNGTPARACIVPAAIAWDDCDCGQLAVSLGNMFYSDSFPSVWSAPTRCAPTTLVSDIMTQVVRCAPSPSETGISPSCSTMDNAARAIITDAYNVLIGVTCALDTLKDAGTIDDFIVGALTYIGPQGGCMGCQVSASVSII